LTTSVAAALVRASEENQLSRRAEDNAARQGAQPKGTSIGSPPGLGAPAKYALRNKTRGRAPSVKPKLLRSSKGAVKRSTTRTSEVGRPAIRQVHDRSESVAEVGERHLSREERGQSGDRASDHAAALEFNGVAWATRSCRRTAASSGWSARQGCWVLRCSIEHRADEGSAAAARSRVRADGRRPGSSRQRALNKRVERRLWQVRRSPRARRQSGRLATPARDGDPQSEPRLRQRVSEVMRGGLGSLSRRAQRVCGQRAIANHGKRSEPRPPVWPKLPRRKTAVLHDGIPCGANRSPDARNRSLTTMPLGARSARAGGSPPTERSKATEREPEAPGEPCGTIL